jgi:hypothetical protein
MERKRVTRPDSAKYLPSPASIRKAYKTTEVIQDVDGEWLCPRAAAEYSDLSLDILRQWRSGCPWLNGKKLLTRKFRDGRGHLTAYYLKGQLNEALVNQGNGSSIPDAKKWVPLRDAAADYGLSTGTLLNWWKYGCPAINRKVRSRTAYVTTKRGRTFLCRVLWKEDLEQALEKASVSIQENKIPMRDAAERLGVTRQAIRQWIRNGMPRLGRKKLGVVKGPVKFASYAREGRLLDAKDVSEMAEALARPVDQPFTDEQGTWLSAKLAEQRYPNASRHILDAFRNKPMPDLGGDPLRARTIPRPAGLVGRRAEIWVYLESDLKRLRPPKCGPRKWREDFVSADKIQSAPQPVPQESRIGGRPGDKRTQAIQAFCYEQYVSEDKGATTVMVLANKEFGAGTIKEDSTVRLYARRYAKKNGLPRKQQKSP